MATNINVAPKKSGGVLGAIGSILGAVAGVAAAPLTGGASLIPTLGTALTGAATGVGIGKTAGAIGDAAMAPKGVGAPIQNKPSQFETPTGITPTAPGASPGDAISRAGSLLQDVSGLQSGLKSLSGGIPPGIPSTLDTSGLNQPLNLAGAFARRASKYSLMGRP